MSQPGLTYDDVKALKPCDDSFRRVAKLLGGKKGWNGKRIDAATARAAGCTFDDLVWIASEVARKDADVERRLRLWLADCAAHVLHIYEKSEASPAPREAIVATRQFARGEIDNAAGDAAWAAARAAAGAAAGDAAGAAAGDAAWAAARAAAGAAAGAAAWAAEEAWQFDRLVERLSEDEPEDWPLPPRAAR